MARICMGVSCTGCGQRNCPYPAAPEEAPPAAPVAVPAEQRQKVCDNCEGEKGFWIDRKDPRNSTYMHDNDEDEFQDCTECRGTGQVTDYSAAPAPLPPPQEQLCKFCGLKIYFDKNDVLGAKWRHHGSNFEECYQGLTSVAIPATLAGETRTEALTTNSGGNMQKQLRSRDVIGKDGLWTTEPWPDSGNYHDPTPEMLANPLWNAIWQEIKHWDINVPSQYSGYSGATGNHVTAIFNAITNSRRKDGAA